MAATPSSNNQRPSNPDDKNVADVAKELWELLVDYGKQETVDPLKRLGRFVAFGVPAMLCLGIGMILLLVAVLRVLQNETNGHLSGHLSWIPYVITLAVAGLLAGLAGLAITRKPKDQRSKA